MKIPGTPRRMEYKLDGVLDDFRKGIDEFSATFTVTAEQFSSTLADAFGLSQDLDVNMKNVSLGVVESPKPKMVEITYDDYKKTTIDPDTIYFVKDNPPIWASDNSKLTPALCSCCGGRIGRDNYCEYCGTRYW